MQAIEQKAETIATLTKLSLKPATEFRPKNTKQFHSKILFLTMMSMLLVLNNVHRQRTITKSRIVRSDFGNGEASELHRKTAIH